VSAPLVEVEGLAKHFVGRAGLFGQRRWVRAVDGVDLEIFPGEILALVGESGSGKTTLGRTILHLTRPSRGRVLFDGRDLATIGGSELRRLRRRMQIVFQDPGAALNPRMRVGSLVGEPLAIHRLARGQELETRVARLLVEVGLDPNVAKRRPHELSGGQRQRVGIARALATRPDFVVCDEPVSSLDVSVQAQIVNLLVELQGRHGIAYLFIGHDLSLIGHVGDRIAVMYLGRIVETAPKAHLLASAAHPYTKELFRAAPGVGSTPPLGDGTDAEEIPSASEVPRGCAFHPRCAWAVGRCLEEVPALREVASGHRVACHRAEEVQASTKDETVSPSRSLSLEDSSPESPPDAATDGT
jgi:oligopeptide/dipeptide ABC transporter ATP-binding protein